MHEPFEEDFPQASKQEHDEVMRAMGHTPDWGGGEHDEIMEILRGNDGDERY